MMIASMINVIANEFAKTVSIKFLSQQLYHVDRTEFGKTCYARSYRHIEKKVTYVDIQNERSLVSNVDSQKNQYEVWH